MNWRSLLLSGVLASGLAITFVPGAGADPLPRVGRVLQVKHHDHHDRWRHDRWRESREHGWHERWARHRDYDRDGDRDGWWDRHDGDRHGWWGHRDGDRHGWWGRNDGDRYRGGYGRYSGDDRYSKLQDRMAYDQAKIAENEGTGRHRKALQWYKDDLRNAQRDMGRY